MGGSTPDSQGSQGRENVEKSSYGAGLEHVEGELEKHGPLAGHCDEGGTSLYASGEHLMSSSKACQQLVKHASSYYRWHLYMDRVSVF